MNIESKKMPKNQDFSFSISGAFQLAKNFLKYEPCSKALVIFTWESFLPDDLREIKLRNGSVIRAVKTRQELSIEDLDEYSFFIYGPHAIKQYFEIINNR